MPCPTQVPIGRTDCKVWREINLCEVLGQSAPALGHPAQGVAADQGDRGEGHAQSQVLTKAGLRPYDGNTDLCATTTGAYRCSRLATNSRPLVLCWPPDRRCPMTALSPLRPWRYLRQAAQRRAAVRRSPICSIALYAGQTRKRSKRCAPSSPIAVPWGRRHARGMPPA